MVKCWNGCAVRGKTSQYAQDINNQLHSTRYNSLAFLWRTVSYITRCVLQFLVLQISKKQGKSHINWGWCPRQGYPGVFLPISKSLTTSPDKKISPGFWWLVEHTEDEQGGKQGDESAVIIHWMLKMEQEAAVRTFRKERMVGDGVKEEDANKITGLRLWARDSFILGSNRGEQECDERQGWLTTKFEELFQVILWSTSVSVGTLHLSLIPLGTCPRVPAYLE